MQHSVIDNIRKDLRALADPEKAKILQGFFKNGAGQYCEGDVFIGVMVPDSRKVAKKYGWLPLEEVEALLGSGVHEERLVALDPCAEARPRVGQ